MCDSTHHPQNKHLNFVYSFRKIKDRATIKAPQNPCMIPTTKVMCHLALDSMMFLLSIAVQAVLQ